MVTYSVEYVINTKNAIMYMMSLHKLGVIPKNGILFKDVKGKPIAAYAYEGNSYGYLYTISDIKQGKEPSHRYAGSADAFDFLKRYLTKAAIV